MTNHLIIAHTGNHPNYQRFMATIRFWVTINAIYVTQGCLDDTIVLSNSFSMRFEGPFFQRKMLGLKAHPNRGHLEWWWPEIPPFDWIIRGNWWTEFHFHRKNSYVLWLAGKPIISKGNRRWFLLLAQLFPNPVCSQFTQITVW